MKRLILGLLTASLVLSPAAAYAETETTSAASTTDAAAELSLPAVGEVIHGFEVKELRDFSDIHGTAVLFEHQRTGAKAMYIATDDTNLSFDLEFNTKSIDDTGLTNILKYMIISGSQKYPSKSLFSSLSGQAYLTYLDAWSDNISSGYPVSSMSEAQLLKMADYFVDSCFHPLFLEDESIFGDQAWHYRLEDSDSDLTIDGNVYNKALVRDLSYFAHQNALKTAFPGSLAGKDNGGDPDFIPDLTIESVKSYHERCYVPSNSFAYLYGKFEDYAAFLKLLDEAYASYEKQDVTFDDSAYTPITEPVHAEYSVPVEAGSSTENQAMTNYIILLPGLKPTDPEFLQADVLSTVLNDSASPLMQKLREALPGGSFSVAMLTDVPEPALLFRASDINRSEDELFKETVDQALAELAKTGFPEDMAEACEVSTSLATKRLRDFPTSGTDLTNLFAYNYFSTGNPFCSIDLYDAAKHITEWNQEGVFADFIAKWLLDQPRTALATTYPAPGEKETKDAERAEKLAEIKANLSEEEKQAIIDATNAPEEPDDSSAYLKELQAVTVDTLPDEVSVPEVRDVTDESGIRHIDLVADLEGIGQTTIYFDSQGLTLEDQHWANLYCDLLGFLPTSEHTREEIETLKNRYLYLFSDEATAFRDGDSFVPRAYIQWIALDEDLAAGYDLCKELLYESDYTAIDNIRQRVEYVKNSIPSSYSSDPFGRMENRGVGINDEYVRFLSYVGDLDYYEFLDHVTDLLSEEPETVASKLEEIQHYFHNRTNAVATFAGNEQSIETNRPLADAFLASLDEEPITPQTYEIPSAAQSEAVIADTWMQNNCVYGSFSALGFDSYDFSYLPITAYISDAILDPQLSAQYGVFSAWSESHLLPSSLSLCTYYDPNIKETFEFFESLPQQIAEAEVDQETLNGSILKEYSTFVRSNGVLQDAYYALQKLMNGVPVDYKNAAIQQIKSVTPEKVRKSAEVFQKLVELGARSTVGTASEIQANAEVYEKVLDPFGEEAAEDAAEELSEE